MTNPFERVVCVTLARREDRWERFLKDLPASWPFGEIEKYEAIDGKKTGSPEWWRQGNGAWGCYCSHRNLIEDCLNKGVKSVLLLEDDMLCCNNFSAKWEKFIAAVPNDWEMLYLGGQHLYLKNHPPRRVNKNVFAPYNVNRTHAWALRDAGLKKVYKHITQVKTWQNRHHIDHHLGRYVQRQVKTVYCPPEWLMGQNDTRSNINGKTPPVRFWVPAASTKSIKSLFVAIVGLHRSGSSCLAGVLHRLGIHMGNKFVGCEPNGGYEADILARTCETALRFPKVQRPMKIDAFEKHIKGWVYKQTAEAKHRGTIAGGKYPHLCIYVRSLENLLGDRLRAIHIDRPLQESIDSLIRREGKRHKEQVLIAHQEMLYAKKNQWLENTSTPVITVQFDDLLADPLNEIGRILDFLKVVEVGDASITRAANYVKPNLRHIGT